MKSEIVDFLLEKDLRLAYLEDNILDLESDAKHEAIDFLGEFELVDWDERKEGRECVQTSVIHFKKFNIFIKEIARGMCHYKDVAIDGLPHELGYFLVEPIETIAYGKEETIKIIE